MYSITVSTAARPRRAVAWRRSRTRAVVLPDGGFVLTDGAGGSIRWTSGSINIWRSGREPPWMSYSRHRPWRRR